MVTLEPTSSSIRVSWFEMPVEDRQGIITGYRLYYRLKDKPDSVQVKSSIPASARLYVLKGTSTNELFSTKRFNFLPGEKSLDWTKLKAYKDDKYYAA